MLWACVLLPQLALDAVLRRTPDPERPLALVTGTAQLRSLHAVNAAAAQAGLKAGQRLSAAHALMPDFDTAEYDPAAAERWHRFLAAWAYRHSSQVSMQWPNAIVLEAGASFRLLGPWPRFEARLRADLDALGFRHRIALAPTPRAALVLAGVQDGLAVTSEATMRDVLARVPVRRAALPDEAGERLRTMGVRHLAQLIGLPRDGLRRRFGVALLEHLDRLYGDADDPLALYRPPDHFDSRIELNYEVESHQALLFPLKRLIADLATYLSIRDGGVQRFTLRLEHQEQHTDVVIGLLAAERDASVLFDLTRSRLEQASVPKPVIGVRLLARELPPFVPAGRDLFDTRPAQAVSWPQLRERLRARLGDEAVYRVAASGDPRPERAWKREEDGRPSNAPLRPSRPAWLLRQPIPLREAIARTLSGPERLESGWWDGDDARRDYYVVETTRGQRAWAFTPAGERDGWMLHGWFA